MAELVNALPVERTTIAAETAASNGRHYCPVLRKIVPADELVTFKFIPSSEVAPFVSYALSKAHDGRPGALSVGQTKHNTLRIHTSIARALNDGHLVMIGSRRGKMAWWKKIYLKTFLVDPKYRAKSIEQGHGATWADLHNREVDIHPDCRPALDRVFYRYVLTVRTRFNAVMKAGRHPDYFFNYVPRWDPEATTTCMYSTAAKDMLKGCSTDTKSVQNQLWRLVRPGISWQSNSATRVYENESNQFSPDSEPPTFEASTGPLCEPNIPESRKRENNRKDRTKRHLGSWFRDKTHRYKEIFPRPQANLPKVPAKLNFGIFPVLPDVDLVLRRNSADSDWSHSTSHSDDLEHTLDGPSQSLQRDGHPGPSKNIAQSLEEIPEEIPEERNPSDEDRNRSKPSKPRSGCNSQDEKQEHGSSENSDSDSPPAAGPSNHPVNHKQSGKTRKSNKGKSSQSQQSTGQRQQQDVQKDQHGSSDEKNPTQSSPLSQSFRAKIRNPRSTIPKSATCASQCRDESPERGRRRTRGNTRPSKKPSTEISAGFRDMMDDSLRLQEKLMAAETMGRVGEWCTNLPNASQFSSTEKGKPSTRKLTESDTNRTTDRLKEVREEPIESRAPSVQGKENEDAARSRHCPSQEEKSSSASPKAGATNDTSGNEVGSTKATSSCKSLSSTSRSLRAHRRQHFTEEFSEDSETREPIDMTFETYQNNYEAAKSQVLQVRNRDGEVIREAPRGSLLIETPPPSIIDISSANLEDDEADVLGAAGDSSNHGNLLDLCALAVAHVLSLNGVRSIDNYPVWSLAYNSDQRWRLRSAFKQRDLDPDLVRQDMYISLRMGEYGINPTTKIMRSRCHDAGPVDQKKWDERHKHLAQLRRKAEADFQATSEPIQVYHSSAIDTSNTGGQGRRQSSVPSDVTTGVSRDVKRSASMPVLGHPSCETRAGSSGASGSGLPGNGGHAAFEPSENQQPDHVDHLGIALSVSSNTHQRLPSYHGSSDYDVASNSARLGGLADSPTIANDRDAATSPPLSDQSPPFSPDAMLPFRDPLQPTPPSQVRADTLSSVELAQLDTPSPLRLSLEVEEGSQGKPRDSWFVGDDGVIDQAGSSQARVQLPLTRPGQNVGGKRPYPRREGSADPFVEKQARGTTHSQPACVGKGKAKEVPKDEEGTASQHGGESGSQAAEEAAKFFEQLEQVASRRESVISQPTKREMIETEKELEGSELESGDGEEQVRNAFEMAETQLSGNDIEQHEPAGQQAQLEGYGRYEGARIIRKKTKGWASWWSPGSS